MKRKHDIHVIRIKGLFRLKSFNSFNTIVSHGNIRFYLSTIATESLENAFDRNQKRVFK